jgi:hypothetical protein
MRGASVHFDFRGQLRLVKRLFQNRLVVEARIVIGGDCDQKLRLDTPPEGADCSARHRSPPPWNEATAPTRSGTAARYSAISRPYNNPACRPSGSWPPTLARPATR